jgi:hypothetical protein
VTRFEGVALIISIFFVVGIGVGFLAVMALPALVRFLTAVRHRDRLDSNGWDSPDIGSDDRDDRPWWGEDG